MWCEGNIGANWQSKSLPPLTPSYRAVIDQRPRYNTENQLWQVRSTVFQQLRDAQCQAPRFFSGSDKDESKKKNMHDKQLVFSKFGGQMMEVCRNFITRTKGKCEDERPWPLLLPGSTVACMEVPVCRCRITSVGCVRANSISTSERSCIYKLNT